MSLLQRQMVLGLLWFLFFAIGLSILTFSAFPLDNWQDLWSVHLFDLPFAAVILAFSVIAGFISGISYGWFWRRKLHTLDQKLEDLMNGTKLEHDDMEVNELSEIQDHLFQLEDKLKQQTELSQRLATERANEREKSLQEVVAQERSRLARELHDSVSQQLFAASMMMSAINDTQTDTPENQSVNKQLAMVEKMIHQSQLEMRALLLHLRPVALNNQSLSEGVEELLDELTQKVPMTIDWKVEALELDKGIEDQLFRILQEAVSNTLRHAKADHLTFMLIERDEHVIMRVVDDGIGFNVEEAKASSYGLQNMQERAAEVGGSLKVVSLEKEGTRLEVKVPRVMKGEEKDD
ncbi:sensor histidine kinase [Thalassobacillus sp. CUG 92003]|uniref:sensor histidine kinase n=1 Tax=Thalassobacillus sp. CUG 92003 TaxID=2736641 RepID=UPI0015E77E54|nr:sensor histidine kinase [Thalassobacillus sp. CUG 92003]